jgi:methylated-DNA-protein-cysteine methyltransferase-like protein
MSLETSDEKGHTLSKNIIQVIKHIPKGRVATYGQIAGLAGNPHASRVVVWTLNSSSKTENLPWYRVINSKGTISLKRGAGYEEQRKLLESEGVVFNEDDKIDLKKYQWRDISF